MRVEFKIKRQRDFLLGAIILRGYKSIKIGFSFLTVVVGLEVGF